jgi:hypothetical protein
MVIDFLKHNELELSDIKGWWLALLLIATSVALFWRPYYFFIHDDWRTLAFMVGEPLYQYLLHTEGEQWVPFFHLAFYGLVRIFGDHYGWLILVTCLGTGLNSFLLYLIFRRHFDSAISLTLSLVYASSSVHFATATMAFYLCYILSLVFFLLALLLTDRYLRSPSSVSLLGIGMLSLLSILSHNYTVLALPSLPLYILLVGEDASWRRFWSLVAVQLIVLVIFAIGYLDFAGLRATASINHNIFSNFSPLAFIAHWFLGSFIFPFFYLVFNCSLKFVFQLIIGMVSFSLLLVTIYCWGNTQEKRFALWALLFNGLPFLLVSFARCHFVMRQAFSERYGVFTLVGALLLAGTALGILARRLPRGRWFHLYLLLGVLALIINGQLLHTSGVQRLYKERSRIAKTTYEFYEEYSPMNKQTIEEASRSFLIPDYPFLTEGQIVAIRQFLRGRPAGQ